MLSVDDDPVNQMVIQTMLSKAGFKVLTAADGQKALDMLEVGGGHGHGLGHGWGRAAASAARCCARQHLAGCAENQARGMLGTCNLRRGMLSYDPINGCDACACAAAG